MNNRDQAPDIALAPLPDVEDWKSPTVYVNGRTLSVDEYLKDPHLHHHSKIPQYYLNSVCQSFPKRLIKEFNLDLPNILKNNKQKNEAPNVD